MVFDILAWLILGFTALRLGVALVNFFSPLYLPPLRVPETDLSPSRAPSPSPSSSTSPYPSTIDSGHGFPSEEQPFLSVLIPARDEADNLPGLIPALADQTYMNYEVIIYDDHSGDATPQILEDLSRKHHRVKWLMGEGLPEGWTGKNHACHRLAEEAGGDLLLFLDADVSVSPDLLEKAVAYFTHHKLSLLSIFPHQIIHTRGEWLTVPLMNWILLSLLPLILVRLSRRPSFSAANGQFMMFDAAIYRKNQWHRQVKDNLVEDIEINRIMKRKGYPTATLLGNYDIMCRMYSSFREGLHGFAKNVTEFFGGSIFMNLLFTVLVITGVAIIPLGPGWPGLIAYILMVLVLRMLISGKSRQSVQKNFLYHIPQMIAFILIVYKGIKVRRKGRYLWKGRITGKE